MLHELIAAYRKGRDFEQLADLAARLVLENDRLRLENAQLRAENRHLRRVLRDRELRLLRRAEADAVLLGAMHFAHLPTSSRAALDIGISRRRWHWARALLKVAALHDGGHGDFTVTDPAAFEELLAGGVALVEADGLQVMRWKLVRNGYTGRRMTPRSSRGISH